MEFDIGYVANITLQLVTKNNIEMTNLNALLYRVFQDDRWYAAKGSKPLSRKGACFEKLL